MDLNLLQNNLYEELILFYSQYGFDFNKKFAVFVRDDFKILWGQSSSYKTRLHFIPGFSVNNKAIYKILTSMFPDRKNSTFYIVQCRDLAREFNCEEYDYYGSESGIDLGVNYQLDESTNIKNLVNDHIAYMNKVGFPFFEKMSTLSGISEFINDRMTDVDIEKFDSPEYQKELDRFFDRREVLSGVISAHLSNHKDIEKLLNRYRRKYDGNNYILGDLEKVVAYLNKDEIS